MITEARVALNTWYRAEEPPPLTDEVLVEESSGW